MAREALAMKNLYDGFKTPHPYVELTHALRESENYFVVNWTFFNVCNYRCSYCLPNLYDGTVKGVELSVAKNFVDKVFEVKQGKKIYFEFTGGEITYYKHFKELFSYIKSKGGFTGIISNGSQKITWWQEHISLIDHACLSFHCEQGKIDHFFQVLQTIHGQCKLHVNMMMLPAQFEELYLQACRIASCFEGISVALQPLFVGFSGPMFDYSEDQKKLLKNPKLPFGQRIQYKLPEGFKHRVFRGEMKKVFADGSTEVVDPTHLIAANENSWLGWSCNVGVEHLEVSGEGYILRGICSVGGVIGNLQDPEIKLPSEPVICSRKKCTCALDIMCSKKSV